MASTDALRPMMAHNPHLKPEGARELLDAAGVDWPLVDCGDGDVWLQPTMGVPVLDFTDKLKLLDDVIGGWMLRPDPRDGTPSA